MDGLTTVYVGKRYEVAMTKRVEKSFKKVDAKERARCQKWMKFFADDGEEFLDAEKYKFEGRFSTGDKSGQKEAIYAFKAWKVRVYGGLVGDVFIATEIDTAKKSNEANRALLESAAKKLQEFK